MVSVSQHAVETWVLTPEGDAFAEHGSPEFRVWAACAGEAGKSIKDLQAELGADVVKIGQLNAFKRKWISKRGDVFVQNVRARVICCRSGLPRITSQPLIVAN